MRGVLTNERTKFGKGITIHFELHGRSGNQWHANGFGWPSRRCYSILQHLRWHNWCLPGAPPVYSTAIAAPARARWLPTPCQPRLRGSGGEAAEERGGPRGTPADR